MAYIMLDDTATGMQNDFEKAVAYLLPIAEGKKKGVNKCPHVRISQFSATFSSATIGKTGCGPSGIKYRLHSNPGYRELTHEKRRDLHQWHKYNPELCKQGDSKVSFQKFTNKGKYVNPDKPDSSDTRPNSKKENQALCSEIA